jgi:hypothetical protein
LYFLLIAEEKWSWIDSKAFGNGRGGWLFGDGTA